MNFKYKQPTLIQTINQIQKFNERGYECYLKGKGNGYVKLMIDDKEVVLGK